MLSSWLKRKIDNLKYWLGLRNYRFKRVKVDWGRRRVLRIYYRKPNNMKLWLMAYNEICGGKKFIYK